MLTVCTKQNLIRKQFLCSPLILLKYCMSQHYWSIRLQFRDVVNASMTATPFSSCAPTRQFYHCRQHPRHHIIHCISPKCFLNVKNLLPITMPQHFMRVTDLPSSRVTVNGHGIAVFWRDALMLIFQSRVNIFECRQFQLRV